MNPLVKSLFRFLQYLGRGATPADGAYWVDPTRPAGSSVCKPKTSTQPASSASGIAPGYRVLM